MDRSSDKKSRLQKRIKGVRYKIRPKSERFRLVFNRSNRYLSAQVVDDKSGRTLCSASTMEKKFEGAKKNREAAKKLGEMVAERAKSKNATRVFLDRRGILYHGRIAEFADAARASGLEF